MDHKKIARLDAALVKAAKDVRVLNALTWPADSEDRFLEAWRAGNPTLPDCHLQARDLSKSVAALEAIAAQCDEADPVERAGTGG